MKKQENKKNKKKLRTLILVLFLTVIMASISTYAWFTANQTVTVDSINVNVDVSSGLQISTDASSWKTKISNDDIKGSTTTSLTGPSGQVYALPETLSAVSTDKSYTDGSLNMFKGTVKANASTGEFEVTSTKSATSSGDYVVFDVFLRTDKAESIYLYPTSGVVDNNETSIGDKGLKNAARVGFVILGNETTDSVSSDNKTIRAANTGSNAVIWEPNADAHTARAKSVASDYGYTLAENAATDYYGLKSTFESQNMIKLQNNDTTVSSYVSKVTTVATMENYSTDATNYSKLFDVEAGVTKVRIYMWIEGQDIDCENNASGSKITYNLAMTTLEKKETA